MCGGDDDGCMGRYDGAETTGAAVEAQWQEVEVAWSGSGEVLSDDVSLDQVKNRGQQCMGEFVRHHTFSYSSSLLVNSSLLSILGFVVLGSTECLITCLNEIGRMFRE
jgi:hypothetical protein